MSDSIKQHLISFVTTIDQGRHYSPYISTMIMLTLRRPPPPDEII